MAHEEEFLAKVAEGIFRVDADGSIWRLRTISRTGRRIEIEPRRADIAGAKGYLVVRLGKRRSIRAHRAVYVALKGQLAPGEEINHDDGAKGHNAPDNIEKATRGQNNQHAYRVLGRSRMTGERNGAHRLTAQQVDQVRALKGVRPSRAVGAEFGVSKTTIIDIWAGTRWAA